MAETYFNNLSPAELERLAILMEEAAEVQHIVGKILRHGYESKNPLNDSGPTNRELLKMELGDLLFAMSAMMHASDVNMDEVRAQAKKKIDSIGKYLHHHIISERP